jgi:hypothetical protein
MTYKCSGCGLRSCDGRCFNECPSDYEPTKVDRYARFLELCALEEERLTEVRENPFPKRRAA